MFVNRYIIGTVMHEAPLHLLGGQRPVPFRGQKFVPPPHFLLHVNIKHPLQVRCQFLHVTDGIITMSR